MPSPKVARPKLPKPDAAPRARTEVPDAELRAVRAKVHATDTSTSQPVDKSAKRGVVQRKGRRQADGERVGAGEAAKATYYVPTWVADEIAVLAIRQRRTQSAVAAEALEAYVRAQTKVAQ